MANSSEWIDHIESAERSQPDWIAALNAQEGFQPGSPFGATSIDQPVETMPKPQSEDPPEDAIARTFAEGEASGRAAAEAEAQLVLGRQRELRLAFRAFDQAALDSLAAELADTVIALCGEVIGATTIDRENLVTRCEAAAARIGGAANDCALRLHPDDIALVNDAALNGLQLEPDASLERGSLLLEGADGTVRDGPAEWRRAIAEAVRG